MERYKVTCEACKETYAFVDFKTGLGKSPEQIEAWRKRRTVCKFCGGKLHEIDEGPSEADKFAAAILTEIAKR